MWLKAIMILATIFMIYHLFYDMKIWRKSGSLIEGMDNSLDDKGRCGPLFNEKNVHQETIATKQTDGVV